MFYALIRNNKIIGMQELPVIDIDVIMVEVSSEVYNNYLEKGINYYIYKDGEIIENPNYEEEQKEKEQQRISNLTCTKRVLILMLEELGLDYFNQIQPLIEANRQAKLEWELATELLRSNPLIDIIGKQLGITHEQLDRLFLYANGEVKNLEVVNG